MRSMVKDELVWTEPREVRHQLAAAQVKPRWWVGVVCILATFLILLAPRFFARPTPTDHPLHWGSAILLALAGATVLVLGYPWFEGLFPVYFRIASHWIIRSQGQTHQRRALWEVESYTRQAVGASCIFTLRLATGEQWALGIARKDEPALMGVLEAGGAVEAGV